MRPNNFMDILSLLPDAKPHGTSYTASCPLPGHATPQGHLSITDGGNKALVYCHGGKHVLEDFLKFWDFDSLCYSDNNGCRSTYGNRCETVKPSDKPSQQRLTKPTSFNDKGITLENLSEAKRIPAEYLQSLGLNNFKYAGTPAVRIPYYDEEEKEIAVRFRTHITGSDRFRWRKGDHPIPYGLDRIGSFRKNGWVLIVEGESDCWTCWLHGIPALGIPGKGIWKASWAKYLEGLDVFVWQEPDAEDFTLRILQSAPDLRYIQAPLATKDISDALLQGYEVVSWLEELKHKAELGKDLKAKQHDQQLLQSREEAKIIIESNDPLNLVVQEIRNLGYGGDIRPAVIVYLAATSRLLAMREGAMPVHLLISGISSSGKSYTLRHVMRIFPEQAYHVISAGSPRTLIYGDAEFQHKILIFEEADSLPAGEDNPAASAIRNLLQDHRLHYEVTIRNSQTGDYQVKKIEKPGPTVLITTSTHPLGAQLMTRLFCLEIAKSKEQISAALKTQALLEIKGRKPVNNAFVSFQSYLQLQAPIKVVVPYSEQLADIISKMSSAPRILRDFTRLLSLVKSVAILRHHNRQVDSEGRIIADLSDYTTVRELVNDMYIDSTTGASSNIRKLIGTVKSLLAKESGSTVTNTKLAEQLGVSPYQISRWAKRAIANNWLINKEQRKHYPADYVLGEPVPEAEGLPKLADIEFHTFTPLTGITQTSPDEQLPQGIQMAPPYPNEPCEICGGIDYRLTPETPWSAGNWLCEYCYPEPQELLATADKGAE